MADLAYALLPYLRDQDRVRVIEYIPGFRFVASVTDGFNFREKVHGNAVGRKAAAWVAEVFPQIFAAVKSRDLRQRAAAAAKLMDRQFIKRYPRYVAAVGAFLFGGEKQDIIVAVGTINAWIKVGKTWEKPAEIGDHFLPYPKSYSGSRTLFGLGEIKRGSFYSARPDVLAVSPQTPVLLATDGLDDVLTLSDLNKITQQLSDLSAGGLIKVLVKEIKMRDRQKDDIAILARF
ncbi:MAG: hypothetical protein ACOY0S_01575 [Patescibacteria group bacterium]